MILLFRINNCEIIFILFYLSHFLMWKLVNVFKINNEKIGYINYLSKIQFLLVS